MKEFFKWFLWLLPWSLLSCQAEPVVPVDCYEEAKAAAMARRLRDCPLPQAFEDCEHAVEIRKRHRKKDRT